MLYSVIGTSCMDSPCDPEQSSLVLHSSLLLYILQGRLHFENFKSLNFEKLLVT